jgi:MFS family permease
VVSLGLIEGLAEAATSLLRIASGWLADRTRRRRPLVIAGYTLSSIARPLIGLAGSWLQVLALRVTDRIGRGIRGAPRDALLASLAAADERGRVFGFHRAMDHAGAIAGPLLASLFLLAWPGRYSTLFLLTAIPGLLVVLLVFRVREESAALFQRSHGAEALAEVGSRANSVADDTAHLPPAFRRYLIVLLVFTLGNSTDAFLLLRLSQLGIATVWLPVLWAALHVIKVGSSLWGGRAADRLGRAQTIAAAWCVYALVYAGFAIAETPAAVVTLFLMYGVYFGPSEAAEKALVADLAPVTLRGTAFGWYSAMTGIGSLLASVLFGVLWRAFGAAFAFATGAALAIAAAVLLFTTVRPAIMNGSHAADSRHE